MADYQKQYLPDSDVQDDKFKISLFNILGRKRPNNLNELNSLLDSNGYYGRHTVHRVTRRGITLPRYRIMIYLPNSKMNYVWPIMTEFEFGSMDSVYNVHRRLPIILADTFKVGSKVDYITIYTLVKNGLRGKKIGKSIEILHDLGLFLNNSPLVRDVDDVEEIYQNLLNPTVH